MPFGGLLTVGLIGGGTSLLGGLFGSNAAKKASEQQVQQEQQALDFQKQIWAQQQQNLAPYLSAGQTSIQKLMGLLDNGTFGPGSTPAFTAPTLTEAQQSPGYQFTKQQGEAGLLKASAAAGGAISGGTLKALDQFNTGLADSTYNDVFTRALSTYQQNLAAQQQQYQQLFNPAALGVGATENLNATGSQTALNVANLMGNIGNAEAAGTVGSANSWINALNGVAGSATNGLLLSKLATPAGGGKVSTGGGIDPFADYLAGEGVGPGALSAPAFAG